MARKKIALIGGGQIGGTLAHLAALKELGDGPVVHTGRFGGSFKVGAFQEGQPVDRNDDILTCAVGDVKPGNTPNKLASKINSEIEPTSGTYSRQ